MEHSKCLELVLKSQSYKKMDNIQKSITKKYANIKQISHAMTVIKNIGFDQWQKQERATYLNRLIIKELNNDN